MADGNHKVINSYMESHQNMFLVKLGGSVVTIKGRYRYFRLKATQEIIKELKRKDEPFVLVHGGGSYGHIKAKEYGIPGEITDKRKMGYSVVHRDMVDLNRRITGILIGAGIRAVGIPPAVFGGRLEKISGSISEYLAEGFTPVSFGDVYVNREKTRFEIVSGDDLMLELARMLKPSSVYFLTDVDGIYDRNPKMYSNAVLLKELKDNASFEHVGTDVTGGMLKKANTAEDIAKLGITVYVLNGNVPSRLNRIDSKDFIGTVIR